MTPHDAARKMRDEAASWLLAHRPNFNTRWWDDKRVDWDQPSSDVADMVIAVLAQNLPLPADDAGEGECPACLGMKEYFNPATGMRRMVPCPECRGTGRPATPLPADDAGEGARGCSVAFCEKHRDVEIVPGPFCPVCMGSRCRIDGLNDGLRANRPATPPPAATGDGERAGNAERIAEHVNGRLFGSSTANGIDAATTIKAFEQLIATAHITQDAYALIGKQVTDALLRADKAEAALAAERAAATKGGGQ